RVQELSHGRLHPRRASRGGRRRRPRAGFRPPLRARAVQATRLRGVLTAGFARSLGPTLVCLSVCAHRPAAAQESPAERQPALSSPAPVVEEKIPSLAELEAAGAVIGNIRVVTHNIFDADDERENNAAYRAANAIHIQTRPSVIEDKLLFKSGDRVSV